MKIGDAKNFYSGKVNEYWSKRNSIEKQRKDLELKASSIEDYDEQAATLEISYNDINDKFEKYKEYMDKITERYNSLCNAQYTRQEGEIMSDQAQEMGKVLEVARRIAKGAKVPATDEKKLMEYSMEMYMSAKNMAMLAKQKDKKEYDSLWDEEKPQEMESIEDTVNDMELGIDLQSEE